MPRRLYLSPLEAAVDPAFPGLPVYRAAVARYGGDYRLLSRSGADGLPLRTWSLVLVDAPDHTALLADPDLYALPTIPLTAALSTLSAAQRTDLLAQLQARGVDTTGLTAGTPYGIVLRRLGRALEPAFDETTLDPGA